MRQKTQNLSQIYFILNLELNHRKTKNEKTKLKETERENQKLNEINNCFHRSQEILYKLISRIF